MIEETNTRNEDACPGHPADIGGPWRVEASHARVPTLSAPHTCLLPGSAV